MVSPGAAEPPRAAGGPSEGGADREVVADRAEVGGTAMLTALVRLHSALGTVRLPLEAPGVVEQRDEHAELVAQLEDYLIPRVTTMDGPLLAVVGGSTGSGKSTLVNSLVGQVVTESGLLRPTTRSPVLVHHPGDAAWFGPDRLLPDLRRVATPSHDQDALQLVASDSVPRGVAILDAPDVDSVDARNRALAAELLAAGDLWLFVTSAARYADQVPWELLRQAASRSTSVAVVLDRTAPAESSTVATHLARMLASRGLKDCPLFTVPESTLDARGLLPPDAVGGLLDWLLALADDAEARAAVAIRTVGGAIRTLGARSHALAGAAEEQHDVAERLRSRVVTTYAEAVAQARTATTDGTLVRGDLLLRWEELAGTGEILHALEERVGRVRDRLVGAVRGKPQGAERLGDAVRAGVGSLLLEHAESAAARAAEGWRDDLAGDRLVTEAAERGDRLARAGERAREDADGAASAWQESLSRMVRAEGGERRSTARYLAYGVDGLAGALALVTLAGSDPARGGVGAARPGTPAAQAGAAGRLLVAVFGEEPVRSLVARARGDLDRRVEEHLVAGRGRYLDLLGTLDLDPAAPERLREAARRIDDLRFRSGLPAADGARTP